MSWLLAYLFENVTLPTAATAVPAAATAAVEAMTAAAVETTLSLPVGSHGWWALLVSSLTLQSALDLVNYLYSWVQTVWGLSPGAAVVLFVVVPMLLPISLLVSVRIFVAPVWKWFLKPVARNLWRVLRWTLLTAPPVLLWCSLYYWTAQSEWGQQWGGGWLFPPKEEPAQATAMVPMPYYPAYYPPNGAPNWYPPVQQPPR